jgi:hypothetical protein
MVTLMMKLTIPTKYANIYLNLNLPVFNLVSQEANHETKIQVQIIILE